MTQADLEAYKQARPYLRGVLALLFSLRFGMVRPNTNFTYFFVMADDFLTAFEQERS